MPLPADIPIPSYLEPPSALQRDQLKMQEEMVREKARQRMEKTIAMAKLQGDASQLQAAGMDPLEARQQALLTNAPRLFSDDPEQMVSVTEKIQTAMRRRQAIQGYKTRLAELTQDSTITPSEAAARAFAEFGPEISATGFAPYLARDYATERNADMRKMEMENRRTQFEEREKRIREMKEADRASKEGMFNTRVSWEREKTDMTEQGKNERQEVSNEIAKRRVAVAEKRAEQPSSATLKAQRELDDEIRQVERNLKKHLSEAPRFFGKDSWQKTKEALEDDLRSLKAERAKLEGEASPTSIGDNPQDPLGLFPK